MFSYHKLILSSGLVLSLAGCNLTVSVNEGGAVQSNPEGINCRIEGNQCTADFSNSTTVDLTATADQGYTFVGWEGDVENFCSNNSCSLPMGKNRSVSASFSQITVIEGIPDSVTWGETIYFTPFGDLPASNYSISIDAGPIGMEQHSSNVLEWTPSHPLFGTHNTVNLEISRTTEVGIESVSKTVSVIGTKANNPMIVNGFSVPTKDNHMVIADIDNDGVTELLMVGTDQYLYSMEYNNGDYAKDWTLAQALGEQSTISAIAAADINSDDHFEIFIAYRNQLIVLDGLTKHELSRRTFDSQDIKELALVDLSNTGNLDLIVSHGERYWDAFYLEILNPTTLISEWQSNELEFRDFAIGQLDEDEPLEIVINTGAMFDGSTFEIEWQYPESFGDKLTVADLDGNGIDELVAADGWLSPVVYNAVLQSPIAEFPVENAGICSLGTEKSDTVDTVLVGDCQHGEISAWNLDGITPEMLWEIDSGEHGSVGVRAADVNNDGNTDYIWSTGISSTGPDDLIIASKTPAISIQWQARNVGELETVLYSPSNIATTTDGRRAIFTGTSHTSYRSTNNLVSIDLLTGSYTLSDSITDYGNLTGISSGDYDNDGTDEVFLSGSRIGSYYDGSFGMYSSSELTSIWTSPEGENSDWAFTYSNDINNDGFLEVIGRGDQKIQIWDIKNNQQLWSSVTISGFMGLAVGQLSNGENALFVATDNILWHYGPHEEYFIVKNSYPLDDLQSVFTYQVDGNTHIALVSQASYYADTVDITILDESLTVISETTVAGIVIDIYQPKDQKNSLWILSSQNRSYDGEIFSQVTAYNSGLNSVLWQSDKLAGYSRNGSKLTWDEASKKAVFATSAGAIISN